MSIIARLDISGLNELQADLRPKAKAIVSASAFRIEAAAKMLAPVDTGALRASINAHEAAEFNWRISDGVEYGIYQELGTSRMAAQPFLTPAFQAEVPRFLAAWGVLFR